MKPNNSAIICNEVYNLYKDILNSYVSDFYLENHWDQKLSNSWKLFLENLTFSEFAELLDYEKPFKLAVSPLTILCLRKVLRTFSITRKPLQNLDSLISALEQRFGDQNLPAFGLMSLHPSTMLNMSLIDFKEKAQSFCLYYDLLNFNQEAELWYKKWQNKGMTREALEKLDFTEVLRWQFCYALGFNIVDIGAGLGHLSRMLAYQYGFNVCTFEANEYLTKLAPELDLKFEKMLLKKIPHMNVRKPVHINQRIEETLAIEEFNYLVRKAFGNSDTNFNFGIVGLHPCGNLGSTLLHLYRDCPNAAFINIVSCCYMKLSLDPLERTGFPLSAFYKQREYRLDYLACETACHAIENYIEKIRTKNHKELKIHSCRAALECLLVQTNENFRHCAVGNVKYKEGMTFSEYCDKALRHQKVKFCSHDIEKYDKIIEDTWLKVVKFYSLRLFLAPIVESLILYDRLLYLQESKSDCDILAVFDCRISPRNHVLCAKKIS